MDSEHQMSAPESEAGLSFPRGFLWGTATATTQVEGHIQNEWSDFVANDGSTCRIACDNYHRYPEDIDWMTRLGTNAHRFGIEWSRLQSKAFAPLDAKELDRYIDMIDRLRAAGIEPMVVLHHFSNPLWLYKEGAWTTRAAISAFVDFVTKLVTALKERVIFWNTFNEPDTYATMAYLLGGFPPKYRWRMRAFRRVVRHMAQAHERAAHVIRSANTHTRRMQVGIAKNWTFFHALHQWSPWDRLTAYVCHHTFNKFVLREFLGGGRRRDSTFLGLNYYGRVRFHHVTAMVPASGVPSKRLKDFGFVCDDMIERYPEGLGHILKYLHKKFDLPIYITEHGAASEDEAFREEDLRNYLRVMHGAMEGGVDVRGFFYWSLMDNFEWGFGYSKKFGLVGVDFNDPNLTRTMKPLGEVYQRICRANGSPTQRASGVNPSTPVSYAAPTELGN